MCARPPRRRTWSGRTRASRASAPRAARLRTGRLGRVVDASWAGHEPSARWPPTRSGRCISAICSSEPSVLPMPRERPAPRRVTGPPPCRGVRCRRDASSVYAQDAAVDCRRHRQPLEEQVEAAPDSDAWLLAAEPQGALVQEAVARIHLAEGRGAGGRGARGGRCVCVWSAVPVPYSSVTWLGVIEVVRGGVRGGGARESLAASLRLGRLAIAEISPRSRRDLAELSPRSSRALAELSPRSRLGRLVVAAHKEDSAWVGRLGTAMRCAMVMTHVMEVRPRDGGP